MMGIVDPAQRIADQDPGTYLVAALAATGAWLSEWAVVAATLLLFAASFWDYLLGRRLAKLEETYDPTLASIGRTLKLNAIVQVWLLWGLESLVNQVNPWGLTTGGYVAIFAALVLVMDELDSLDENRTRHGQRPLFGWRQFAAHIRHHLSKGNGNRKGGGRDEKH
jgi:hypothetical protein